MQLLMLLARCNIFLPLALVKVNETNLLGVSRAVCSKPMLLLTIAVFLFDDFTFLRGQNVK